jgi:hypothetical protein
VSLARRTTLGCVCLLLVTGVVQLRAQQPSAAVQSRDTQPEPVLVELRLDHIAGRTVQAYRIRSEVLVPLTQFLQLAEIRYRLSPAGRLEATVDPGARRLVIDVREDSMHYGGRRVRIEPEFKWFHDGELYVGAERLGDLLGSPFGVDFAELTATLADPKDLPLARRLRREAARGALLQPRDRGSHDLLLGYDRPQWDGLVFDYSVLAPSDQPLAGSGYSGALGADVLGGSLEVTGSSVGRAAAGLVRIDASWTGVWRDNPWLQQLRLGDAIATGPASRLLRGVSISNSPFVRPSLVGVVRYDGQLEPGGGWSVEAYRGGELMGFDSAEASGRFRLQLPVRYGENPVDFVAYGPLGQIREFNQTFRVLNELLPAKRFEYGLSAGACRSPACTATGNLDLRYGVTERWTVQGGLDRFWRGTRPDVSYPYASVAGSVTNAWAVTFDGAASAFAHGGLRYEPSVDLRLTADYTRYAEDTAPILTPPGARSRLLVFGFVRPLRAASFFFFDGTLDRTTSVSGATTNVRIETSTQGQQLRWLPYARLERNTWRAPSSATDSTHSFVGMNAFLLPYAALGPVLGPLWVRSGVEAQLDGAPRLSSYSVFAARQVGSALRASRGCEAPAVRPSRSPSRRTSRPCERTRPSPGSGGTR